jgi:hypothetical protein
MNEYITPNFQISRVKWLKHFLKLQSLTSEEIRYYCINIHWKNGQQLARPKGPQPEKTLQNTQLDTKLCSGMTLQQPETSRTSLGAKTYMALVPNRK